MKENRKNLSMSFFSFTTTYPQYLPVYGAGPLKASNIIAILVSYTYTTTFHT